MIKKGSETVDYVAITDANNNVDYPVKVWFANTNNTLKLVYERTELELTDVEIFDYIFIGQNSKFPRDFNMQLTKMKFVVQYPSNSEEGYCGFGGKFVSGSASAIFNRDNCINLRRINESLKFFIYDKITQITLTDDDFFKTINNRLIFICSYENGILKTNTQNINNLNNGYISNNNADFVLNGSYGSYALSARYSLIELQGDNAHFILIPAKLKRSAKPYEAYDGKIHPINQSGLYDIINKKWYGNQNCLAYDDNTLYCKNPSFYNYFQNVVSFISDIQYTNIIPDTSEVFSNKIIDISIHELYYIKVYMWIIYQDNRYIGYLGANRFNSDNNNIFVVEGNAINLFKNLNNSIVNSFLNHLNLDNATDYD